MHLIFVGQGYPQKLFNLEHFPIYGMSHTMQLKPICKYQSLNKTPDFSMQINIWSCLNAGSQDQRQELMLDI